MNKKSKPRSRTAILGGDGRRHKRLSYGLGARVFPARKYGGNGLIRALKAALRSGNIDRVVLLVRFLDHSTSEHVKRLCRRLGVKVEVDGGVARRGPTDENGEEE